MAEKNTLEPNEAVQGLNEDELDMASGGNMRIGDPAIWERDRCKECGGELWVAYQDGGFFRLYCNKCKTYTTTSW